MRLDTAINGPSIMPIAVEVSFCGSFFVLRAEQFGARIVTSLYLQPPFA